MTDGTAGLNALEAGEVDAVPVITIDLWEQLTKRELDKKFTLVTYPQIGEPTYAVFNQKLDPALRHALAATLDRQSYNDAFGASWGAENTCTFALPNQPWYAAESAESCPYPFDYEGAMAKAAAFASTPLEYASLSDVPDLSLPADIMIPAMQGAGFNVTRNAIDLARYSQLIFQGRPPQFDITVMSGDAEPTQWGHVCRPHRRDRPGAGRVPQSTPPLHARPARQPTDHGQHRARWLVAPRLHPRHGAAAA